MWLNGWVKLWRKSINSAVYTDELWRLWCHCIMRANHEPTTVTVDRLHEPIQVDRGQFITGRFALHEELYPGKFRKVCSPSSLWRRLQLLEKLECLTLKSNSRFTLVSVCNYETYNSDDSKSEQQVNSRRTAGEQQVNTEEEVKEVQEGKKKPPLPPLEFTFTEDLSGMNSPGVVQAIADWIAYKKSRGEGYKSPQMQIARLLKRFGDPQVFIDAVDSSISHNYAGCFAAKGTPNGKPTHKPGPGQKHQPKPDGDSANVFGW